MAEQADDAGYRAWPDDVVERLRAFEELGERSVPSMLDELERVLEERHPQLAPLRQLLALRSTRPTARRAGEEKDDG